MILLVQGMVAIAFLLGLVIFTFIHSFTFLFHVNLDTSKFNAISSFQVWLLQGILKGSGNV